MILYRFSHIKYAGELSGEGAKLRGGRWNPVGLPVVYTSESISLALLEILANSSTLEELQMIRLTEVEIPGTPDRHEIKVQNLKKNWQLDFDYTQWMGKEIMNSGRSLLVQCPSAIIPREKNYLINPAHPDFKKIKVSVSDFYFDQRLFKGTSTSNIHI